MPDEINLNDLDAMLKGLKRELKSTNDLRDPIINKLAKTIEHMEIDFENDKGTILEQKLNLIEKFDKLLGSRDTNELNAAKMMLQKKTTESAVNMQEQAVAMLKAIAPGSVLKIGNFAGGEAPSDEEIENRINNTKGLTPIGDDEMHLDEIPGMSAEVTE